ncbi:MAG: ABC transporter ATP-binding protein, partial [Candidatus Omnitrophica bacterium]|nr:ABC transporter ATP-binding protein [Candidatus Omnitrophota bacterium]
MSLLEVEGLTKRFGGVVALDRLSFRIQRETISSLIGPNGAGKTTLFNCITGILRPEEGRILFGGSERLERYASHEIARFGIARTFQNIRLFQQLTVLENVLAGTHVRTRAGLLDTLNPMSGAHQEDRWALERSTRLLEMLKLDGMRGRLAGELSYGQQRRLELARALVSDPEFLLLDEPAAGLTQEERRTLMEFLKGLKGQGMTILLIEHDMGVVMPISDWVVVLDDGAKIAEGPPKAVQEDP